jgi:hypothetical protein
MFVGDIQGAWWLPDHPQTVVSGTLTIAYDARPTLNFVGQILEGEGPTEGIQLALQGRRPIPVVYGRASNGARITLGGGMLALRDMHLDEPDTAVYEIAANVAFIGAHLDPHESKFDRCELALERLVDWSGFAPFARRTDSDDSGVLRIELSGELPERIPAAPGDGGVSVRGAIHSSGDQRGHAALDLSVTLSVDGPSATFAGWIEDYIGPLQRLVSLAVDRPIEVDTLRLASEAAEADCEVIWKRRLRSVDPKRLLLPDEILFTAESIRPRFAEIVDRWLHAYPRLLPVLDMYFASEYASSMYEEDRFQNLVQAVEAYHRRMNGNRPDPALHEKRTSEILAVAPPEHHEWLEGVLLGAGEYRLSDRIEQLLHRHEWLIEEIVPKRNAHRWATRVGMARNFRAHHDPGAAPVGTKVGQLVGLTQRLKVLIQVCLLAEAGFQQDESIEMVKRASSAYMLLKMNPEL